MWVKEPSESGSLGEDLPIIGSTPSGAKRRQQTRGRSCDTLCEGVAREAVQRRAHCFGDYCTALRYPSKTLAAALFMFFATLFSTVALGHLIEKRTGNRIGLSEYLAMNAIAGVTHALIGAQPLLVLRPTGPITAITEKLGLIADRFGCATALLT